MSDSDKRAQIRQTSAINTLADQLQDTRHRPNRTPANAPAVKP